MPQVQKVFFVLTIVLALSLVLLNFKSIDSKPPEQPVSEKIKSEEDTLRNLSTPHKSTRFVETKNKSLLDVNPLNQASYDSHVASATLDISYEIDIDDESIYENSTVYLDESIGEDLSIHDVEEYLLRSDPQSVSIGEDLSYLSAKEILDHSQFFDQESEVEHIGPELEVDEKNNIEYLNTKNNY